MIHATDFAALAAAWSAPVVARDRVTEFSGGLLHPRTMANLDARGEGPPRLRFGRKVAYPTAELVRWMQARAGRATVTAPPATSRRRRSR